MPLGALPVNLTSYCPFKPGLSPEEQRMEGGLTDAHGSPLFTYEAHKAGEAPYVSCAGDLTLWRYGQRVELPSIDPDAIFRVVDTGAAFHGEPWYASSGEAEPHVTAKSPRKKIRVDGHEPIDVCVNDCGQHPPGFGAQLANVPDDGAVSKVANAVSDALQSIGVDDVDLPSIAAIGVGLASALLLRALGVA
jgi:hypothetical protein